MKSGLEELYVKIAGWFIVLEGYLDDKDIGNIFRMCRIKPFDPPRKETSNKFRDHWIDEFGNSIYIKDKMLNVVLNDLKITQKRSSDLYGGLSLNKIIKLSKVVLIEKEYITCLGIDKYLRTFTKIDGKWIKCSPLLLGIDKLRLMNESSDIKHTQEKDGWWLGILPIPKDIARRFDLEGVIDEQR